MKKSLVFIASMAISMLFIPNVFAKSAPTQEGKYFFANGTPITISERTDGQEGAIISDGTKEYVVPSNTYVFGGSHESDERIESVDITMNGGQIHGIAGGGLHKSNVGKVTIVVNGGKIDNIQGGGAASLAGSPCHKPWYDGDAKLSPTRVDEVNITINGGSQYNQGYSLVYGGGEGISYVGKATLTVNGGTWDYVIAGGSNGYTGEATLKVTNGNIATLQSVNRGSMEQADIEITGGEIKNAYVGGDSSDKSVDGTITKANMVVTGGKVENLSVGTNGGQNVSAKDVATLEYNKSAVTNIDESAFNEDTVTKTVTLTFDAMGEKESVEVPEGSTLTAQELKDLQAELEKVLAGTEYKLAGFYKDAEFKEEYDFSTPITEDLTVYIKLEKVISNKEEAETVTNPDTADINLIVLLSILTISVGGLAYTLKKRKFN